MDKKELIVPVSLLLIPILGIITKILFRQISDFQIIISIFAYGIFVIILYTTFLYFKIKKVIVHLNELVNILSAKEEMIISLDEIANIEKKLKKKEIWVLSSDLSWDIEGKFWRIVKSNITKGNRYKYFLPRCQQHRYKQLIEKINLKKEIVCQSINCVTLEDKHDTLLSHYVIYNPYERDSIKAYMLTPRAEKGFAITLDATTAVELADKLKRTITSD